MTLPTPVRAYFAADESVGGGAPMGAFAPDAVVEDEGRIHLGRDAIEAWWSAAKAQFQHTAVPREVQENEGLTLVRAEVTGRFPGSPALLTFAFRLDEGRIAALEIRA